MAAQYNKNINDLLEKAAQIIECGPECQKKKETDLLLEKYLAAQNNSLTAPIELEKAKMNYYLYANPNGYDLLQEDLTNEVNEKAEKMLSEFNKLISYVREKNNVYSNLLENAKNTKELYLSYLQENGSLEKQLKDLTGDTLTNDRKTYYQDQGISTLDDWYNLMKWVFYFIIVVIGVYLFLTRNNFSIIIKIVILLALSLYPLIVSYLFPSMSTIDEKYFPKDKLFE